MAHSINAPLQFNISPVACIWFAFLLLLLPMQWLFAAFAAAVVHELGHYAAISLLGGSVTDVCLGQRGTTMNMTFISSRKEAVCALAGPVGGCLLLLTARYFPRAAICALVQTAYNLLPIYPLDGGRALRAICSIFLTESRAERFCSVVAKVCITAVCILCGYAAFVLRLGVAAFIPWIMIILKSKKVKMPCKQALLRVQ